MKWVQSIFDFMDKNYISRRIALYLTIWQTWDCYSWAKSYVALHADKPAIETAAIVGAVLGAVTALQGVVLKLYGDGAKEG